MRRITKKKILELLESVHEAHIEIRKYAKEEKNDTVNILLSDCQNVALQIGNVIEERESNYLNIIRELEEYCEVLYQVSLEITSLNADQCYAKIEEQLDRIITQIEDIKVKLEVLFLPYKVSMWDSLESVWHTAMEDEGCNCYVVPIPYFEKDVEGNLVKECYEGKLFPKNVPIIDWREYDLETRRPDIIFIHNPYDGWNKVTTIHSSFYSKNLRKYTDMLVYIPYFVSDDGNVEEHFCILPGTLYSDKVIVQNEKEQKIYERNYRKFVKENKCEQILGNGEGKFLPLGSPKFDRVLSNNGGEVEIPSEWKEKISGKKVLFYNTSIQELLNWKEKYLDKIREVIECVEQQKDIVLLWRPHPLMQATLHAMLPDLEKDYIEIVNSFKERNIGIYDNTADFQMAMALSDAYYGDHSSILTMYKKTRKHILIQNIQARIDNQFMYGGIEAAVVVGNTIWASAYDFNGLLKICRDTGKMELVARFPNEALLQERLFDDVVYVDGKLVFVPMTAKSITIYNIEDNTFKLIPIEKNKIGGKVFNDKYKFCRAVEKDKNVYLIGCTYAGIIKINLLSYEVVYQTEWIEEIVERVGNTNGSYFRSICIKSNEEIWLACNGCNILVQILLENMQFRYYEVGDKENCFSDIVYDGELFWISSKNGNGLLAWNPVTTKIVKQINDVKGVLSSGMFISNKKLFIVPWYGYDVWVINICTGTVEKKIKLQDKCIGVIKDNTEANSWIIFTDKGRMIKSECFEKGKFQYQSFAYYDNDLYKALNKKTISLEMYEGKEINFYDYIHIISDFKENISTKNNNAQIGKKIFIEMKNIL